MRNGKCWTDGSATLRDDRKGGSGVYLKWDDGEEIMLSKGWRNTKTGRAEIHAFLLALKHLRNEPSSVTFYMDSEYVMRSVIEYMPKWLENNWMGSAGPVKNRDLWLEVLEELDRTPKVLKSYVHVKGHQDRVDDEIAFGNSVADHLASYKNQESWEDDFQRGGVVRLKGCYNDNPSRMMSYYLHKPSSTYFVEETGKDFKDDSGDVKLIGRCVESTESELEAVLFDRFPLLHRDFKTCKLRSEIRVS